MLSILKRLLTTITSFLPELLLTLFTKYKLFMTMLFMTVLPVALKYSYYLLAVQFLEFLNKNVSVDTSVSVSSLPCGTIWFLSVLKIDSAFSILMSAYIMSLLLSLVKPK